MMHKYLYETPDSGEQLEGIWIACDLETQFDIVVVDEPDDIYHGTEILVHWDCYKHSLAGVSGAEISPDLLEFYVQQNPFIMPDPDYYQGFQEKPDDRKPSFDCGLDVLWKEYHS